MNESWESKLPDLDMQAVPKALARAAKRAREIARLTNTPFIVVRNGVRVDERGDETTADPLDGSFKDLLEQMPEVGTDEDLKRSDDRGGPVIL